MATISTINVSVANDNNGDTLRNAFVKTNDNFAELNSKKVEAELGKGLSENDFTDADKTKLDASLTGSDIANNLTTNVAGKALDATKGKELDNKITDVVNLTKKTTIGSWFEASFTKDYYGGFTFSSNNGGAINTSNYQNKGSFFGAGVITNATGTLSGYAWSTRNTLNGAVRYDQEYYYLMLKLNGDMPSRNIVFGVTNEIYLNTNTPNNGTWLEINNRTIALKGNVGASIYSSATATLEADVAQDPTSNNIYRILISTNKALNTISIKVKNLDNSVVLNETITQVGIASSAATLMNYTLRVLAQAPNGTNYLPAVINGVGFGKELPNNLLDF